MRTCVPATVFVAREGPRLGAVLLRVATPPVLQWIRASVCVPGRSLIAVVNRLLSSNALAGLKVLSGVDRCGRRMLVLDGWIGLSGVARSLLPAVQGAARSTPSVPASTRSGKRLSTRSPRSRMTREWSGEYHGDDGRGFYVKPWLSGIRPFILPQFASLGARARTAIFQEEPGAAVALDPLPVWYKSTLAVFRTDVRARTSRGG
jgi:hypothetical protein